MTRPWLEKDDAFIPAHWMATTLLDLVMSEQLCSHRLLAKTGIFYEDLTRRETILSPEKSQRLIKNCVQYYSGNDLSFRLGQRIFPGYYGAFSRGVCSAPTVLHALELIQNFGQLISPLLVPRLKREKNYAEIRWYPAFFESENQRFLSETYLSAVTHSINALCERKLPWEYDFTFKKPVDLENYELYFGGHQRFERPVTRIVLPEQFLSLPFGSASQLNYERALSDLTAYGAARVGILSYLRDLLRRQVHLHVTLDSVSQQLGYSCATLKRKLRNHGSSFRYLLDAVRMEVAIDLVEQSGFNNGQVAEYLGYFDEANYRRSFKRWTGLNPSEYGYLSLQGIL
ncbi:AraC-like DNA-binding protein [Alteromonadaceae bacterium 2753L.S.0a.02]|nr:AraC-like DNA-binding protein [Alteromonadaceae bacterium 2753L.S.0a.02]